MKNKIKMDLNTFLGVGVIVLFGINIIISLITTNITAFLGWTMATVFSALYYFTD